MPREPTPTKITNFISHRWAEGEHLFANELASKLQNYSDIEPILDEFELLPGDSIQDWMLRTVVESDIVLYILSPASVLSPNCKYEITAARKNSIPVIPILLRDCSVPSYLKDILRIDFREAKHIPYDKLERLVAGIRKQAIKPRQTTRQFLDPINNHMQRVRIKRTKKTASAQVRDNASGALSTYFREHAIAVRAWIETAGIQLARVPAGQEVIQCIELANLSTIHGRRSRSVR